MAKTRNQIQRESENRRNIGQKKFNLNNELIAEFEAIAKSQNITQVELFKLALEAYKEKTTFRWFGLVYL